MFKSCVAAMRQPYVHKDMLALIDNALLTSRKTIFSESLRVYLSSKGDTS